MTKTSRGTAAILAEVKRQRSVEGYTFRHDVEHGFNTLASAAWAYYYNEPDRWPWDIQLFKPKDRLSNLIRAGALAHVACEVYLAENRFGAANTLNRVDAIAEEIDALLIKAASLLAISPEADDMEIVNLGFGPRVVDSTGRALKIKYVAQPDGTVGWRVTTSVKD